MAVTINKWMGRQVSDKARNSTLNQRPAPVNMVIFNAIIKLISNIYVMTI